MKTPQSRLIVLGLFLNLIASNAVLARPKEALSIEKIRQSCREDRADRYSADGMKNCVLARIKAVPTPARRAPKKQSI